MISEKPSLVKKLSGPVGSGRPIELVGWHRRPKKSADPLSGQAMRLVTLLLDVLGEGGPRKPAILRSLADSKGLGEHFDAAVDILKSTGKLKTRYRNGGPHYALATTTRREPCTADR